MSEHSKVIVEKNISLAKAMEFCAAMAKIVDSYEKKKRQVKYFFNGEETTKGAMGLMVNLTSVNNIFSLRVEVTGQETEEEGQKIANEVFEKIKPYLA
ncbi:MAG: hypothetical protein WCJ94_00905 [bacterium]